MNAAVRVETPEAALAAADHVLGDVHAKLTLVEYRAVDVSFGFEKLEEAVQAALKAA